MEITANNQILVLTAKASVTETSISLIRRYGPPPNVAFSKWPLSSINCPPYPCYRLHYLLWQVSVRVNRFNATFLLGMLHWTWWLLTNMKIHRRFWKSLPFFHWDILVICPITVLNLAITVFISLPFQILWPNFFRSFQKNSLSLYDQEMTEKINPGSENKDE